MQHGEHTLQTVYLYVLGVVEVNFGTISAGSQCQHDFYCRGEKISRNRCECECEYEYEYSYIGLQMKNNLTFKCIAR